MHDPIDPKESHPAGAGLGEEGFHSTFTEKVVFCNRLEKRLPVHEHAECSYCHGTEKDIATGKHERFCGYDPTRDPIHFGFPGDTVRDTKG